MKDDLEMKEALEKSIVHWENIRDRKEVIHNVGNESCALCNLYLNIKNDCKGCPVMEETKANVCTKSPYVEYRNYINGPLSNSINWERQRVELAQNEIDFLYKILYKHFPVKIVHKDFSIETLINTKNPALVERAKADLRKLSDAFSEKAKRNVTLERENKVMEKQILRNQKDLSHAWGKFHTVVRENNALRKENTRWLTWWRQNN